MAEKGRVLEVFAAMPHYPTHKEKTQRAFRAYVDLIDTGEWLKGELRGPLESFDVTMGEFRLLELLYREGRLPVMDLARKRRAKRQNLVVITDRLGERGWVRRRWTRLPPMEFHKGSHVAKARLSEPRVGRRVSMVSLTKSGEKFVGNVLPRHSKLVKSLMRVLDAREQDTLSRICRKLREGDVLKFIREIRMEDQD
jgi:MarR family transcriptional regulator, 2-MHQ and catechol-resistance regulon repressor